MSMQKPSRRVTPWHRALAGAIGKFAIVAAAGMGLAAPAHAFPVSPITTRTELAMWWGDFAALEADNAELRRPGHIDASAGLDIEMFRRGVNLVLNSHVAQPEAYLRELEALTLQWAGEHPRSALAHVLYAKVLVAHAWSYRGGGYARDVPPQAWKDFEEYLRRAATYLKDHADVAMTDSYAHLTLLHIGQGLGWDASQMKAIMHDGLKRNPEDVMLYFAVLTTHLPKWGGDVKTLDKFIREVTEETRPLFGTGMYARLYSLASEDEFGHALFEASLADWPTMKKGYEDMHQRYPNSPQRRNGFAHMACLAKDKATLVALLAELGPNLDASAWGTNGERSLESCQRWAGQL